MPDLITEAAGRVRIHGVEGALLERILGGYRRVYEVGPEQPGQALAWLLSYDGPAACPAASGRRVRVEHDITAIRVPAEHGYELHLPERGVVVHREAGQVRVAGASGSAAELLRKALRQVVTRAEQRQGMVQLHASAVAGLDGWVHAFVGPREAGKTTTLATALLRHKLHLVTNDRLCLVARTRLGLLVYGWPTDYTVGHGTLQALGLWDRVPVERRDTTEKMHFSPEYFARLCGVEYAPRGQLQAIAFMQLDLGREDVELSRRDKEEAISEILSRHLFTVDEDEDHPDWLELGGDLLPGEDLESVRDWLRGVRFYSLRIGRNVNAVADGLRELLGGLWSQSDLGMESGGAPATSSGE